MTGDWRDDALCLQVGDCELWFPPKSDSGTANRAKKICARCPVRVECLEWALANDEKHGIWGGLNERARRALKPRTVRLDEGNVLRRLAGDRDIRLTREEKAQVVTRLMDAGHTTRQIEQRTGLNVARVLREREAL